jgi:hypothetical protein
MFLVSCCLSGITNLQSQETHSPSTFEKTSLFAHVCYTPHFSDHIQGRDWSVPIDNLSALSSCACLGTHTGVKNSKIIANQLSDIMCAVDLCDMALFRSATRLRLMYLLGTLVEVLTSSNRWDYITRLIKYDLTVHWPQASGKRALGRGS